MKAASFANTMSNKSLDVHNCPMPTDLKLPRLVIFLGDFTHAQKFASHILEESFHTRNPNERNSLMHLAFTTSLIVSYARPFGPNYELGNEDPSETEGGNKSCRRSRRSKSSLDSHVANVLRAPEELQLHDKVLELRDTAYGHSDAIAHLFNDTDYDGKGMKVKKYPYVPLTELETRNLKRIIAKWIAYLKAERSKLSIAVP